MTFVIADDFQPAQPVVGAPPTSFSSVPSRLAPTEKYAIVEGAYLLESAVTYLPVGVHVAVVDPGVGTERLPIAVRAARGDFLVGPDNGLLLPAADRLGGVVEARALENRALMLAGTSATFHGRDVFAPMAAHLATGTPFPDVGRTLPGTIRKTLARMVSRAS